MGMTHRAPRETRGNRWLWAMLASLVLGLSACGVASASDVSPLRLQSDLQRITDRLERGVVVARDHELGEGRRG